MDKSSKKMKNDKENKEEKKCKYDNECECHKKDKSDTIKETTTKENMRDSDDNTSIIDELNLKLKNYEEALLREKAEVANFKRRKDEETNRILKYKNEDILKEFLPIIDNFERAIKMDDDDLSDEVFKFLEGFKIIYSNTLNLMNKFEVKEINASGLEFDPTYHHAVLTEHDENKPAGVVLEVLQKGYMYKDKVIRPAMVKVNE